ERLRSPFASTKGTTLDLARAPFSLRIAARLYGVLIAPLAERLKGSTRVLIVPDGPLHLLPFEALVEGDANTPGATYASARYLIDRAEISYLPTAAFVRPTQERSRVGA